MDSIIRAVFAVATLGCRPLPRHDADCTAGANPPLYFSAVSIRPAAWLVCRLVVLRRRPVEEHSPWRHLGGRAKHIAESVPDARDSEYQYEGYAGEEQHRVLETV